jgi:hypothetical protein
MQSIALLVLFTLVALGGAALAVHLWRRANYTRWLRRGHSTYKLPPRRGLFG